MAERERGWSAWLLPLVVLPGVCALLASLWGGVHRLGWNLPLPDLELPARHAPLMVLGFFGTVVGIERAVARGRRAALLVPLAGGLSGIVWLAGGPLPVAASLGCLSGLGLALLTAPVLRPRVDAAGASLLAGALAEAGGAGVWLATGAVAEAAPWWLAFLVLTIAGERRELARILMPHRGARWAYAGLLVSILAALATGLVAPETGTRMLGAGFLLLGLWLLRWDMATRTVRRPGLSRFMGLALLLGHGWLAIGGLLGVLHGDIGSGPLYDARIHAITLGFVFSMIFAHAPVILPALVHRALPFRPWFHVHLALLHATLALRVTGDLAQGDGAAWAADARLAGGLGNAGAILLFLITTVLALRPASRSNPVTRPG